MAICQHKGDDKHQPEATSPKANRGDEAPAQGGHKDQPKATRGDEAPARRQIPYIDNIESTARTEVEGSVANTVSTSSWPTRR